MNKGFAGWFHYPGIWWEAQRIKGCGLIFSSLSRGVLRQLAEGGVLTGAGWTCTYAKTRGRVGFTPTAAKTFDKKDMNKKRRLWTRAVFEFTFEIDQKEMWRKYL